MNYRLSFTIQSNKHITPIPKQNPAEAALNICPFNANGIFIEANNILIIKPFITSPHKIYDYPTYHGKPF